jgi:hypothetical protein
MKQEKDYSEHDRIEDALIAVGHINLSEIEIEEAKIAAGCGIADEIYEKIMNDYAQSSGYNDKTDVIGSSQFLRLFHRLTDCLRKRGYSINDLSEELKNNINSITAPIETRIELNSMKKFRKSLRKFNRR